MEWRRFLKLYFMMIVVVAAVAGAAYGAFIYRGKLARIHVNPREVVEGTTKAGRETAVYLEREVPLLPGKISRGFKKTMHFIRTSGNDPERDLETVGLIEKRKR